MSSDLEPYRAPPAHRPPTSSQKAPKNPELNGLVQAQDPVNGDAFFDPATKTTVQRGSQANVGRLALPQAFTSVTSVPIVRSSR